MTFISNLFHAATTPVGPSISLPLNPFDNPAARVGKYVGERAGTFVREHPEEIKRAVHTATSNVAHNATTLAKVGAFMTNPLAMLAFRL
jgi:hypothetical protein